MEFGGSKGFKSILWSKHTDTDAKHVQQEKPANTQHASELGQLLPSNIVSQAQKNNVKGQNKYHKYQGSFFSSDKKRTMQQKRNIPCKHLKQFYYKTRFTQAGLKAR